MIKGCQKKIIYIKKTGSPYFEEAYFVLKNTPDTSPIIDENDMLREALRLTESTEEYKKSSRRKKLRTLAAILTIAALQVFIAGAVFLVAALFL